MKLRQVALREPFAVAGVGQMTSLKDCETCPEGVIADTALGRTLFPWAAVRHGIIASAEVPAPSESEQLADTALDRAAEASKPKRRR